MVKEINIFAICKINDADDLRRFLDFDERQYGLEFKWNEKNPEYLICDDLIYSSRKYSKLFKKYYNKSKIRIFFGDEAVTPDFNLFDYAISYDKHLSFDDRFCRRPVASIIQGFYGKTNKFEEINKLTEEEAHKLLLNKKRFCNFIYTNPFSHENRDKLFYTISNYKQVDSLGTHLNNVKIQSTRDSDNWFDLSVSLKSNYKFSIASENANFSGYTSEKIISSFMAHTIPIYFGNPLISEEFNDKAFINCYDYNNFDEVLKRIKEIDSDDELWCRIVSQPWKTKEQSRQQIIDTEKYKSFLQNIFCQDIDDAIRINVGTTTDGYRRRFFTKKIEGNLQHRFTYYIKEYIYIYISLKPTIIN